jgi:peptide/nickel transport system substrate-binding protein
MMEYKIGSFFSKPFCLSAITFLLFPLLLNCTNTKRHEKAIIIGLEAEPVTLDPHLNSESATWTILGNIFEGLVGFDREMNVIPLLAVSWENPDDITWTFDLRRNVYFHNGQALKAGDVVYSLDRALNMPRSGISNSISSISGFTALNDYQVKITTSKPNPILLNKLTNVYIVPRGYYEGNGDSLAAPHPIGTGPYKFEHWLPKQHVILTKNEKYYGKRPAINRVTFVEVAARDERAQALLSGSVNLIRNLPSESFGKLNDNSEFKLLTNPGLMVSYLGLDMSGRFKPFLDNNVRSAIYLAINIDKIIDKAIGGYGIPAGQLVPPGVFGYNPAIKRPPNAPKKSKILIKESKWPEGFKVTLDIPENARKVGELIAADLSQIGITVRLEPVPWRQFYNKITSGRSDFYLVGWDCTSGDASDIFTACLHSIDLKTGYGSANIGRYSNLQLDSLIEMSNHLLTNKERQLCLQGVMRLAMNDLPLIPLYMQNNFYGIRKQIKWQPRLDERIYVSEIEM